MRDENPLSLAREELEESAMQEIAGYAGKKRTGSPFLRGRLTEIELKNRILSMALMALMLLGVGISGPACADTTNYGVYVPQMPWSAWPEERDFITLNTDSAYQKAIHPTSVYLGYAPATAGALYFPVWNKSGGALAVGDACVFDSLKIAVTADTAKLKPARLVNALTAEGGPCYLAIQTSSGTASSDSLWIYGKDSVGTARTEIVVITNSVEWTRSGYLWTDIDSVEDNQSSGGWTTFIVYAQPYLGVTTSGGAVSRFAGLATAATADNAAGYIAMGGYGVTWGVVDGASTTIWPGDLLYPAASGDLAPATQTATTTGSATFTQDSLSTLAQYVDTALPIDSAFVKGHITLGTFTTTPTIQIPVAIALEPCFTDNRKIRVAPIR